MRLEVIVLRQDSCTDELFLQDGDEVKQVFRRAVADVVHLVGRQRQSVFAVPSFWCVLHHPDYAFHNVVYVCKVTFAVAVVEDFDLLFLYQLVCEAEIGHVGAAARAIYSEEPQACGRYVVQLAVCMRQQFVALLGRGIQAYRVVHTVIRRVGHFLVRSVNTGRGCVDEMLDAFLPVVIAVAAGFEYVVEAYYVALDVCVRIGDAVPYSGLCGEIDHNCRPVLAEYAGDRFHVGYGVVDEGEPVSVSFQLIQSLVFKGYVIVVGDAVYAYDFAVREIIQQPF